MPTYSKTNRTKHREIFFEEDLYLIAVCSRKEKEIRQLRSIDFKTIHTPY